MIVPQAIYHPLYTDSEKFIILITGGRGSMGHRTKRFFQ